MSPDPPRAAADGWPRPRPGRRVRGHSAVLLPFDAAGRIDWRAFAAHLERTAAAGLVPAVNMDTGYVHRLDAADRARVLELAKRHVGEGFVAGAWVPAEPEGARWRPEPHREAMARVREAGGLPVVFPSPALGRLEDAAWVEAHAALARDCDRFLAFELGPAFVPFGRILEPAAWAGLLDVPACLGAKHSSLSREAEWQRLALRDARRPDFLLLTGNDRAIDMVLYGSDYLLGLSTFAPDFFARRDALLAAGDPAFFAWNDLLQYLGELAFRDPVPAYRHSAAQFLHLRGWIATDRVHPGSPTRPASDRALLAELLARLEALAS